jgi:hypothetical protein
MVELNRSCVIDDILNVRLQTLGIAEHRYDIMLSGVHYNWLMYDVGGAVGIFLFSYIAYSPIDCAMFEQRGMVRASASSPMPQRR